MTVVEKERADTSNKAKTTERLDKPELQKSENEYSSEESENENGMEFDSLDEFKEYYLKNKAKLDKITTVVLNQTYKIKGYLIRRNHGILSFKTIKSTIKISKTEKRLAALENAVNQMIHVLNQIQERMGL